LKLKIGIAILKIINMIIFTLKGGNMRSVVSKKLLQVVAPIVVLTLAVLACGFPGTASNALPAISGTNTPAPTKVVPITGNQATAIPTVPLPPTQPSPTPTPAISHLTRPETPSASGITLYDSDSSGTASLHRPQGGDYFNSGLFERPFNPNTQDQYFPQVDITQSSMVAGNPWIYGSITVVGPVPTNYQSTTSYGLELDTNMDGRGDFLVVANNPKQGDWSTDGVQVFADADHDVGGKTPIYSDSSPQGTGYEQKMVDSGVGADPDLAWARVDAGKPNVVWFAFKSSLINNANKWMWGAWAQIGGLSPEMFDYNDHFPAAGAGAPMPGDPNYPLKELAELDNTCRWAVGFTPTGNEPGICQAIRQPTPQPPTKSTPKPTATHAAQPTSTKVKIFVPPIRRFTLVAPLLPTPTPPPFLE
jgi:hypothetical protein